MNGFFLKNLPDRGCLEEMAERYPEMNPDAAEVYLHFLRLGADVGNRISDYLAGHKLSTGRMSVMMMLNSCPNESKTPGELAERCGVTAATISRLVDGLIKDGHVQRVPDPENRRVSPIRMTDAGRKHLEQLLPGYFKDVARMFGPLSANERNNFLKLLNKLQSNLNEESELS
ncbi:MarR family transcriptional regulator [Puniceicoccales bacterium CK1056]|uniref:MarR family transcriptional regulator n=1 Tax=Oceanipulchritudo coccoides TaxID=2706888 RepID=A0A6B2M3S8_9BACT|nr:MarR family transcriptional regulator [Oceanipulchritudo coccoides]NDV62869.1 MarR family transcriptional regulator [Oceanipulchritudo coccoides]